MSSHHRSSNSGLQLSRTTKGIQNSRRSIRGLGISGAKLGDELARIDNKGSNKKPAVPKKKPSVSDDLSIDDSVPSIADIKAKKEREERRVRESNRASSKGPLTASSDHVRSSERMARRGSLNASSEHARSSDRLAARGSLAGLQGYAGRMPRRGSLDSASDASRPKPKTSLSPPSRLSRSSARPPSRSFPAKPANDISESITDLVRSSKEEDHHQSFTYAKPEAGKSQLQRKAATYNGKTKNTVQGIYKILNSMEHNKDNKDTANNSKETPEPSSNRRSLPGKTKSIEEGTLSNKNRIRTSLSGIRNLLDKKDPNLDENNKERSSKNERSSKRQEDDSSSSDETEDRLPVKIPETGANPRASLHGIQKLLGSMSQDKDTNKEKEQGEVVDEPVAIVDESKPEEDSEEENDHDTVATPKTATDAPLPAMKEAPPPPQRRNVARKPRNQMPQLGPPKSRAPTGSFKSAPSIVPATPMRSPDGLILDIHTPVAGRTTPQQDFSTPQALPVVPGDDFDNANAPRSAADVTPPPISSAPPPPPKRNIDPGSRWKNRQNSRVPEVPGKVVSATRKPPKPPSMSIISPGGIVIEVSSKKSGSKGPSRTPEPMTPMSDMTPMTNKSGALSGSPHYRTLRNSIASKSPLMTPASQRNGFSMEMTTPSMRSCCSDDISELTPGTYAGNTYRGTPTTPSLYNSPDVMSELTPGGYSVGLYGDDDYQGTFTPDMKTPSLPNKKFGVIHEMTPGKHGILLEEDDEEEANYGEITALPSTPSVESPAGVNEEVTPGSHAKIVGAPPLRFSTSMESQLSELSLGTPSVKTPNTVVSDGSPNEASRRDRRIMAANLSAGSGAISEITGGSVGQVKIAS